MTWKPSDSADVRDRAIRSAWEGLGTSPLSYIACDTWNAPVGSVILAKVAGPSGLSSCSQPLGRVTLRRSCRMPHATGSGNGTARGSAAADGTATLSHGHITQGSAGVGVRVYAGD